MGAESDELGIWGGRPGLLLPFPPCSRPLGGGMEGEYRRPRVQTFSNRDSLQAFRAVASSTSTGPKPKMSRRSSLFWGQRGQ